MILKGSISLPLDPCLKVESSGTRATATTASPLSVSSFFIDHSFNPSLSQSENHTKNHN